jgi:hypothetical protein
VRSIALPGLGAATGKTPVEICADLMWTAYDLFKERQFDDFKDMRKALEEILGDLGSPQAKAKVAAGEVAGAKGYGAPAPKYEFDDEEDLSAAEDFDDFDD